MYPLPEPISAQSSNYISVPEYTDHIFCVPYEREPLLIFHHSIGVRGTGKTMVSMNEFIRLHEELTRDPDTVRVFTTPDHKWIIQEANK